MTNKYPLVIVIVSALLLSQCGFHLRGYERVPDVFQLLYIKSSEQVEPAFKQRLTNQINHTEARIASNPSQSPVTLNITKTKWDTYTLDAQRSTEAQVYEVSYTLHYQIETKHGKAIVPEAKLQINRQLIIKAEQLIGNNEQLTELKQQMRQDMAQKLLKNLKSEDVINKMRHQLKSQYQKHSQ